MNNRVNHYSSESIMAVLLCVFALVTAKAGAGAGGFPDEHNVVWDSQSANAGGSMGDTEHARRLILKKLGDGNLRFTAFFPVGHDWQPDHNWGGNGMIALEEMLMQTIGDEIRLLPAWPAERDADFRLHAPRQTTVRLPDLGGKWNGSF